AGKKFYFRIKKEELEATKDRFEIILAAPVQLFPEGDTARFGEEVVVPVKSNELVDVARLKATVQWDPEKLIFLRVETADIDSTAFDRTQTSGGRLSLDWKEVAAG